MFLKTKRHDENRVNSHFQTYDANCIVEYIYIILIGIVLLNPDNMYYSL
jgi:hypothetical protein